MMSRRVGSVENVREESWRADWL